MLSPYGRKAREKREKENPQPIVFAAPKPVAPDMVNNIGTTAQSTASSNVAPAAIKPPTLQERINRIAKPDAPQSMIPTRPSTQEIIARGGTITAGTPDPSEPAGRKIPFIGKVLFGRGNNKLYAPGTIAGGFEKEGVVGFLTEGFTSQMNPTREKLGDRIYERYSKLVESGTDEQEAIDKAIADIVNRTLPTMTGQTRAVDELAVKPGTELTEDEDAALFWMNQREKLFAVLDAPIFAGTTKALKATGETVTPLVRDQIIERLSSQGGRAADELTNRQVDEYLASLQKNEKPTVSELNRGVQLLEATGRPYEDLSDDLAKRARESIFGVTETTAPKQTPAVPTRPPIADARLRTKVEVPMRDVAGTRFVVPADAVLTPKLDGNKATFELDGTTYTVPKNQYDNLKGQSTREVAEPFAPELDGLEETIRGTSYEALNRQYTEYKDSLRLKYGVSEYQNIPASPEETAKLRELSLAVNSANDQTKYAKYTLPGGENYREILIQAPASKSPTDAANALKELENKGYKIEDEMDGSSYLVDKDGELVEYDELPGDVKQLFDTVMGDATDTSELNNRIAGQYKSPHWDEPNVISHIRANERVVNGEKHFFLEELQSDWARDGRQKGFNRTVNEQDVDVVFKEPNVPEGGNPQNYSGYWEATDRSTGNLIGRYPGNLSEDDALKNAIKEKDVYTSTGVPYNPALDNWQVSTLKRALIEAERSGADRFTWVNGAQTRERYKLSKEVESISWGDDGSSLKAINIQPLNSNNPIKVVIDEKGMVVSSDNASFIDKTIDDVLGKGIADRIMAGASGKIADDGLNIGGAWANNLYDRQVRDIIKKLTGAKIEEVDLGLKSATADEVFTFSGNHPDVGGFADARRVKTGDNIANAQGEEFTVVGSPTPMKTANVVSAPVYATAKNPMYVTEDDLSWTFIVGNKETLFGKGVFATREDAYQSALNIGKEMIRDNVRTVKLGKTGNEISTMQQSIRLTPEVVAKIKSQAPDVTVNNTDARAYAGVPLIFGSFDTQVAEAGIEGATGLPEGISEDEEGNIVVDPKKAFLGMAAAGFIGANFSRAKGPMLNKLDAPDAASSRPGQRELPGETPLPEKGQTRYPLSTSQFSDSLSKSYLETGGKTIDEATEGLMPGAVNPQNVEQFSGFRKAIDEAWVSTVEAVQDNLFRVRRLVQDPNVKVTDDTDPYLAELLFHGRVGNRISSARDTFIDIDRDIIKTAKNVGVPEADMTLLVNKFLHARHAPERNARLGDGAAGLTNDEASSIMADIDALPYAAEVKRVADRVAEMNTKTLDILREAQVIDDTAYDSMRKAYANHVPLQRVLTEDQDVVQALSGRGFDVKSSGIKYAKGSSRQVADILANVVTNYEQAIVRAEKNRVDLATLQFARDNANLGLFEEIKPKAIGVKFGSESLTVKKVEGQSEEDLMGQAYEQYTKSGYFMREDGFDVAELAENVDQMETMLEIRREALASNPASQLGKYANRRGEFKGELPEVLGSNDRFTGRFSRGGDDIITELGFTDSETARQAYKDYLVQKAEVEELAADYRRLKGTFTEITRTEKANDKAARAAYRREVAALNKEAKEKWGTAAGDKFVYEQITDPRVLTLRENGKAVNLLIKDEKLASALKGINRQYLPGFVKFVGAFTRFYSGLQTRFNPEFAFPNKIRDLQEAVVYAGSRGELGFKGGVRGALDQRAYLDVLDNIRGVDSEGAKLYQQMIDDGGTTGGLSMTTKEQVELDIEAIRKMNRSNPRKAAETFVKSIDNFNTIFEDSTRLSLYKEALRRGVSRKRAAEIAKEASVNFNKFGTGGPVLNSLWMFSNASIQGTTKMLRAMRNPKVAAVVTSAVGSAVWATGEWNDRLDPKWRDKVTVYDRTSALIVVLPPDTENKFNYIAIPVGWGIKPIKVSMDYAYDAISGHSKSPTDVMSGIAAATVNSYNPLGGTDLFSSITPTILDLPSEIARNKAWHGGKIMPDWDQHAPDSIRYFSSLGDNTTGSMAIQASEGLSGIGIEVSPASLYYAYQGYVGGAGRTATDVVNTMITLGRGELPESNDVPVWSRFIKQRDNEEIGAASGEYEEIKERLSEQSRERFYLKQDAENSYRQLDALPKEEAAEIFEDIAAADPALAKEIADIMAEETAGVTYTQRLVKQLGVANGERAQFIVDKFNQLETNEEKAALWEEYTQKKIITPDVAEQITAILAEEKD